MKNIFCDILFAQGIELRTAVGREISENRWWQSGVLCLDAGVKRRHLGYTQCSAGPESSETFMSKAYHDEEWALLGEKLGTLS